MHELKLNESVHVVHLNLRECTVTVYGKVEYLDFFKKQN